ncbi:uncharacterized protein LOC143022237 [Oratosquilla oratoria]|uniref:uncharacterized protein LOC143022237 n=1 Tax=Oratosquilla oratoria TaxID=337810 RepID=UPI003F76D039
MFNALKRTSVEHLPGLDVKRKDTVVSPHGVQMRSHAVVKSRYDKQDIPSLRRSSFHGSESCLNSQIFYPQGCGGSRPTLPTKPSEYRKREAKYNTQPLTRVQYREMGMEEADAKDIPHKGSGLKKKSKSERRHSPPPKSKHFVKLTSDKDLVKPTLPPKKDYPQAPYRKTFIAMIRSQEGKGSSGKRRSQELHEVKVPPKTPPPVPVQGPGKFAVRPAQMHNIQQAKMLYQQLEFVKADAFTPPTWWMQPEKPLGSHGKNLHKKKAGNPINRSESCKEKQNARKRTRENRKHSDPNIPTSKAGDVDGDPGHLYTNSGSSSNSSLSQSQESPSTSLEQVPRPDAPLPNTYLEHDSDIEADLDLPDWQKAVPHEQIKRLKPKERKRQDTINELFHTERTHVRVLKVLKHLFRTPMLEVGFLNTEYMDMLFPNLDQVLEFHAAFNNSMKQLRNTESLVGCVGDLLLSMFDGEASERFQQVAADFIKCQGVALEHLKQRQKKDQRLANFLQIQENHQACRRLQLKDMLPAGFQRLTKYPLLLESLQAYTDSKAQPEEYEKIGRALERSREILAFVNAAVQEAENHHRLLEIQKRLDQASLTKNKGPSEELRGNLDLSKHKLIYEGPLTWRISKGQKNIDLHVLLLDDFIVLLQKVDDKYILKNHSINISVGKEDTKFTHSPIIKYGPSTLFRAVATDKCAFFLVTTQSVGAQIYELVAISANERKVWFRHIQEAQETYSQRDGRNRRPHPQPPLPDPEEPTAPPSDTLRNNVDDNVDGDVEGDTSESATPTGTASSASAVATSSSSSKSDQSITKPGEATVATASTSATTTSSTSSASPSAMAGVGQPPASPETLAKKAAAEARLSTPLGRSSSHAGSGAGGISGSVGGRHFHIHIEEGPTLIQPSEVKVSQGVVLSAQPVLTPIECLRRKDVQIRTALDDKQRLIADILHIPYEHFESVADIAGEPGANKEPRELVLAAIFQAKYLQEILNETLTLRESDIVAAGANDGAGKANLPLYQAPMNKLLSISTSLSEQLSALLNAVSERDDERERMRKELVASRERLHLLHMRQNQTPPSTAPATSPHTSRPSSFVSVGSSTAEQSDVADHHDTDEEISLKQQQSSSKKDEGCDDLKDDSNPEMFLDAMSSELSEGTKESGREEEVASSGKEGEETTATPSEAEATTGEVTAILPAESEQADVSTT